MEMISTITLYDSIREYTILFTVEGRERILGWHVIITKTISIETVKIEETMIKIYKWP